MSDWIWVFIRSSHFLSDVSRYYRCRSIEFVHFSNIIKLAGCGYSRLIMGFVKATEVPKEVDVLYLCCCCCCNCSVVVVAVVVFQVVKEVK